MVDLRTALRLDAVASGALGLLLLALAGVLDGPLGIPSELSALVGAGLLGWAALVSWVAATASRPLAKEVVAGNVVWVLTSVVFSVAGWVDLTNVGVAFVLAQALAVLGLTGMQAAGLRTATRASAAG